MDPMDPSMDYSSTIDLSIADTSVTDPSLSISLKGILTLSLLIHLLLIRLLSDLFGTDPSNTYAFIMDPSTIDPLLLISPLLMLSVVIHYY